VGAGRSIEAEDRNDTIMGVTALTGTGERYATAVGELWSGLSRTLTRLDAVAADPVALGRIDAVHALRRLQYALHLASEEAFGLEPPEGARTAHAELAAALACARDATAEVAEAVSVWGAEGVAPLLHEWRGTLFRVRLARLRLAPAGRAPAAGELPPASPARPLISFLLALGGAVAFVGGATLGWWPLWGGGLAGVLASILVFRP
jgi:hypothetical protein